MAILTAAAHVVATRGYEHLTMEGVAADAGVGKQTIYRWWRSRSALVADCLVEGLLIPDLFEADPVRADEPADPRADIARWLHRVVDFVRAGNVDLVRSLLVAAAENPDVAAGLNDRLGLWSLLDVHLGAAVRAGLLPPETPLTELGEAMVGAIVLRVLRQGPLDAGFVERLLDALLASSPPDAAPLR